MLGCFTPSSGQIRRGSAYGDQEFTQLDLAYQLATRDMEIRENGNPLGLNNLGQMEAIGFDLIMEMLEGITREIPAGRKVPQVDDTQNWISIHCF